MPSTIEEKGKRGNDGKGCGSLNALVCEILRTLLDRS